MSNLNRFCDRLNYDQPPEDVFVLILRMCEYAAVYVNTYMCFKLRILKWRLSQIILVVPYSKKDP